MSRGRPWQSPEPRPDAWPPAGGRTPRIPSPDPSRRFPTLLHQIRPITVVLGAEVVCRVLSEERCVVIRVSTGRMRCRRRARPDSSLAAAAIEPGARPVADVDRVLSAAGAVDCVGVERRDGHRRSPLHPLMLQQLSRARPRRRRARPTTSSSFRLRCHRLPTATADRQRRSH